tara:strand:- start:673 stop:1044 length:372 start_codon:yes stop_codon:yes gene_type:complete
MATTWTSLSDATTAWTNLTPNSTGWTPVSGVDTNWTGLSGIGSAGVSVNIQLLPDTNFQVKNDFGANMFTLSNSGNLAITSNNFGVKSDGVVAFKEVAVAPTAVSGGLYYNSTEKSFYLGVEI